MVDDHVANQMDAIRRKAEKALVKHPDMVLEFSKKSTPELTRELSLSHIQLEMQNEELSQAQERIEELRARLEEAEQTLEAIRTGQVDAILVSGRDGHKVYTLEGADYTYRNIVETMNSGAVTLDPTGTILYSNNLFSVMTGFSLEKLIGSSFKDVVVPPYESAFLDFLDRSHKATKATKEIAIRGSEGPLFVHLSGSSPTIDGEKKACIVITDISRRKQAEESLQKAHDELRAEIDERRKTDQVGSLAMFTDITDQLRLEEQLRQSQKMEAIGTLAGGIAHDFNNILAVIIGNSELALDDLNEGDVPRRSIEQIFAASQRARELVKQILTFSRRTQHERKPLTLTPVIKETYKLLRSSLPSTIKMVLDIKTGDRVVLADPSQIQQVLMNLGTNAGYAMRENGGTLTIGLSDMAIIAGCRPPHHDMPAGRYIELTVKDTGSGIPAEVRKRIFEPFFTTKETGQGTGMGLAVVHGIVKSHGGQITVESTLLKGSTFKVYLPEAPAVEPVEREGVARIPTGNEHILFVDDEAILAEMTQAMLERLGYRVTVATRGSDAWNLFLEDTRRFDLVITDQTMPDLTGLTLAEKMLEIREDIPIILCTGYSETVSAERTRDAGIREFVMKPLVKRELAEAVRRVLDNRTV